MPLLSHHFLLVLLLRSMLLATDAFTPLTSFTNRHLLPKSKSDSTSTSTTRYMKGSNDEFNFSSSSPSSSSTRTSSSTRKAASSAISSSSNINLSSTTSSSTNIILSWIQQQYETFIPESFIKILSAALLITSNTVGASMMVLPSLASGPGLMISSSVICIIYLIHLFSGLLIADVAINQYETSSCDVPSSFKQFADVNFDSNVVGTIIACISMFVNMCVLSFDIVRGGQVMVDNVEGIYSLKSIFDPMVSGANGFGFGDMEVNVASIVAALGLTTLVGTQSNDTLSKIASICCVTLFVSFAGLVLPGLAAIQNPIETFITPGLYDMSSTMFLPSLCSFAPIALMSMVYQNIVPTITKMLNYDRKQVVPAIALGSLLPMIMYVSFCFVEIGSGGMASSMSTGGVLMEGIKVSSLIGSAMACTMSISQEVSLFVRGDNENKDENYGSSSFLNNEDDTIEMLDVTFEKECLTDGGGAGSKTTSLPSVALSVIPPLLAGIYLSGIEGDGILSALSISGSYGTPLLYGIVPVLLALNQRSKLKEQLKPIVPGGMVGLGVFGTGSIALIADHLIHDVSNLL